MRAFHEKDWIDLLRRESAAAKRRRWRHASVRGKARQQFFILFKQSWTMSACMRMIYTALFIANDFVSALKGFAKESAGRMCGLMPTSEDLVAICYI